MGNYSFKKDFNNSKQNEFFAKGVLAECCGPVLQRIDEVPKKLQVFGDLMLTYHDGTEVFVECKEDFMTRHTGNLAIECFCREKPSGISISKAHFWLITAHTNHGIELYLIETETLRNLIDRKKYKKLHTTGGDKGSNTHNYLFDRNLIKEKSKILFEKGKANIQ